MVGFCGHGNELPCSKEGKDFLYTLRDYYLLRQDHPPHTQLYGGKSRVYYPSHETRFS